MSGIPPPLRGSGASRVHNTTLAGSGSPEATPTVNGSADSVTAGRVDVVVVASVVDVLLALLLVLVGSTTLLVDDDVSP
jgi:hypothetical protein